VRAHTHTHTHTFTTPLWPRVVDLEAPVPLVDADDDDADDP
jgi:hypothetical protein